MTQIKATKRQLQLMHSSLRLKATKTQQSTRNLERRKEEIIAAVGQKEYDKRMRIRNDTITDIEQLLNTLSVALQA